MAPMRPSAAVSRPAFPIQWEGKETGNILQGVQKRGCGEGQGQALSINGEAGEVDGSPRFWAGEPIDRREGDEGRPDWILASTPRETRAIATRNWRAADDAADHIKRLSAPVSFLRVRRQVNVRC
jgi:hypothetical protein